MKKIRIIVFVLFLIAVFVSITFGFSFLWGLFSSITLFDVRYGILDSLELSLHRDLRVFEISTWIAFVLLILNAILFLIKKD